MSVLAKMPTSSNVDKWNDEEKAIVEAAGLVFKHSYGPRVGQTEAAPRPVVAKFLSTVQRTGLDPLARQIYCIGRLSGNQVEWSIQTAIDGFRVIAERSNKYAGQGAPEWLTEKGEWVDVFVKAIHGNHPLAARVNVYRSDWDSSKPAVGIATWEEYAQTKKSGDLTAMWLQRGAGQLAKCAEALALRKALPQDLAGMYTDDEMQNSAQVIEVDTGSTRDWEAEINNAESVEELAELAQQLKESGQATDKLRALYAARLGLLEQKANTVDAEVVEDDGDATVEPTDADTVE